MSGNRKAVYSETKYANFFLRTQNLRPAPNFLLSCGVGFEPQRRRMFYCHAGVTCQTRAAPTKLDMDLDLNRKQWAVAVRDS